jgi:hypothetical protein
MYHAVYEYEWYKLEPEKARTLMLLMIRTNKPLHITAGKMFPMTMSMFYNVSDFIIAPRIIFVNFINFEAYTYYVYNVCLMTVIIYILDNKNISWLRISPISYAKVISISKEIFILRIYTCI